MIIICAICAIVGFIAAIAFAIVTEQWQTKEDKKDLFSFQKNKKINKGGEKNAK